MLYWSTWLLATVLTVGTTSHSVDFDTAQRGAVVSVRVAGGRELAVSTQPTTLFYLKATATNDFNRSVNYGVGNAASFNWRWIGDGIELEFSAFPEAVRRVTCKVLPEGDALRWRFVTELEPGWALEANSFPRLALTPTIGKDDADDRLVVSTSKGGVYHSPGRREVGWAYHGIYPMSLPAQFAAFYDNDVGLYFSTEDAEGNVKRIGFDRTQEGLVISARAFDFAIGRYVQPYDTVTVGLARRSNDALVWQDAANRYRQWAHKQAWCRVPTLQREDLPRWMKDAPVMTRFARKWLDRIDDVHRWLDDYFVRQYASAPLVVAIWGWEQHGEFVGPDYFPVHPSEAAFSTLVDHLRKINAHCFTWPSGYRWSLPVDANVPIAHAIVKRDGSLYGEKPVWLKGGENRCLCGGDQWTRNWWDKEVVAPLARRGSELIQIDQQVGGGGRRAGVASIHIHRTRGAGRLRPSRRNFRP